ncbi:unnamed protein product [Nesidiocoris tenuis]|uniref:Uncharacterized protein n=1 Tax=Nesidiocoris tenuis TaxID=355587 RepID=A0A6H5GZ01_9HEMI|nr:unnamed protein product [Nesidiocoris tenuis]
MISIGSGPEPPQHMSHEVVLVAMMQPFKEKRITQLSLLEASREEWISRHLIDGTIVFSDHRVLPGRELRQKLLPAHEQNRRIHLHQDPRLSRAQRRHPFGPVIRLHQYPRLLEMRVAGTSSDFLTPLKVDDPSELNNAIEQLLSDLPVDQIHPRDADAPVPDEQFAKCAMVSKTLMPPVHVHSSKLGVVSMPMIKKGPRYSRPSVITRAKEKRAVGEESLTAKKIKHETAESPNPMSLGIVELNRSVIKSRDDYMEMELGSNDSLVSGGSIQLARYATSPADSYTATSPTEGYVIATSPIVGTDQLTSYLCDESTDDPSSASSILVDPSTSSSIFHEFIAVDSLGPCQPSISIGFWGRDIDSLEEGVARSHIQLNERMQFQDIQINAIEEDLSTVPVSSDGNHMIRSTFTHLKAEHRKQQQMLKTLKQDHQSLQQGGREQLSVRGAQDIGA